MSQTNRTLEGLYQVLFSQLCWFDSVSFGFTVKLTICGKKGKKKSRLSVSLWISNPENWQYYKALCPEKVHEDLQRAKYTYQPSSVPVFPMKALESFYEIHRILNWADIYLPKINIKHQHTNPSLLSYIQEHELQTSSQTTKILLVILRNYMDCGSIFFIVNLK